MASADFEKLNDKMQSTSLIFLSVISIILLAFWYFAYGAGEIYVPSIVIAAVFLIQHFLIRPMIKKTIGGLKEGKK